MTESSSVIDHENSPIKKFLEIERGGGGVSIGVRAGGARGAAAPPNFGQLGFFWAARENLGKTSFLRRFRVF